MDPLSLLVSSATLVDLCTKVSSDVSNGRPNPNSGLYQGCLTSVGTVCR